MLLVFHGYSYFRILTYIFSNCHWFHVFRLSIYAIGVSWLEYFLDLSLCFQQLMTLKQSYCLAT